MALGQAECRRIRPSASIPTRTPARRSSRAWASSTWRSSRPSGARVQRRRQRRQAAGRLQGDPDHEATARAASSARPAATASTATPRSASGRRPKGFQSSTTRSSAASSPRSSSSPMTGDQEASRPGRSPAIRSPGRGRPDLRQLPRGRLVGNRLQDRRLDGLPGRLQSGPARC